MREVGFDLKALLLLSPRPGAGVLTVSVNLAAGLSLAGHKVVLASFGENPRLRYWLENATVSGDLLLGHNPDLKVKKLEPEDFCLEEAEQADYLLLMAENLEQVQMVQSKTPFATICIVEGSQDDSATVLKMDENIEQITGATRGIDLLVPNKVHSGEWEEVGQLLMCLGERWGFERVADPLPH